MARGPAVKWTSGDSELLAVPSVHFRVPFAHAVNEACSGRDKPDVVAVELGPESARAAHEWLRELASDPRGGRTLPCMLGIAKPLRRVRPSLKPDVWQLQAKYGRSLADLPREILKDELGISNVCVLYLSPTDSIIEAIRCAVELQVPVHGVDLEDAAHAERRDPWIEDPTSAQRRLPEFVNSNGRYAEQARCSEVDDRREFAMAARLKGLMRQYRRVLFVCGLAHWTNLSRMLSDDSIHPAPLPDGKSDAGAFTRVLVHPGLAVYHMDVFPFVARQYGLRRTPAQERSKGSLDYVHAADVFERLLEHAYSEYFECDIEGTSATDRAVDLENRKAFEQLLANLCLLKGVEVPDVFTVMEAAQAVMSDSFCSRLASCLMDDDLWANPNDFPELPVLHHVSSEAQEQLKAEYRDGAGRRTKSFYVDSRPGDSPSVRLPLPWEWVPGSGGTPPGLQELLEEPGDAQPTAHPPGSGRTSDGSRPPEPPPDDTSEKPLSAPPTEGGDDTREGEAPPEKDEATSGAPRVDGGDDELETGTPDEPPHDAPEPGMPDERPNDAREPGTQEENPDDRFETDAPDEPPHDAQEPGMPDERPNDAREPGTQEENPDDAREPGTPDERPDDARRPEPLDGPIEEATQPKPRKDADAGRQHESDEATRTDEPKSPYSMPDSLAVEERPVRGSTRTWPPEGVIMTLLSIRADQILGVGRTELSPEPFGGNMLEGIDIRSTLRARARGDDTIYVRERRRRGSGGRGSPVGPSTTVIILDHKSEREPALEIHGMPLRHFREKDLLRKPMRLEAVAEERGNYYCDGLSFKERIDPGDADVLTEAKRSAGIHVMKVRGVLAFVPHCFDMAEEAVWLEDDRVDYSLSPIFNGSGRESLARMYRERHGLDIEADDWVAFLVRAAIPYASGCLNVIADHDVALPSTIHEEAARLGVSIRRLPTSLFPPDYVRKIRYMHIATPFDDKTGEYPELVVRAMGERWDAYRELLPDALREYRERKLRSGV